MRLALVAGATRTARIEGISAAGASPELAAHTPGADAEIVAYGRPVRAPAVPVSPTGCPTPAIVTRAVRELVGFGALAVDAGLARPTAAPTVSLDTGPGGDVRDPEPVAGAADIAERARDLGRSLPGELLVGESIPGGTTTALGVLAALGEPFAVSSSLPENPIERKREVVAEGLAASGIDRGEIENPVRAVRLMGDPVLAAAFGLCRGALAAGTEVTLAGGTQMVAVGALLRAAGVEAPIRVATTPFVADDPSADIREAARALDLDLVVTDPGFDCADHPAMERYRHGEAKEGVGMGGALDLAAREGTPMQAVRERVVSICDRLGVGDGP